jgi:hypothetical protein
MEAMTVGDAGATVQTVLLVTVTLIGIGRWLGQLGDPQRWPELSERMRRLEDWRTSTDRTLDKTDGFRDSAVRKFADLASAIQAHHDRLKRLEDSEGRRD